MLTVERDTLLKEQALQRQDSKERYLTDRANREEYETLLNRIGDAAGYRVTFLDGVLNV